MSNKTDSKVIPDIYQISGPQSQFSSKLINVFGGDVPPPPPPPAWLPTDKSGLILWYDVTQLSGLSDNDLIATLPDLSSAYVDATASGAQRPTYKTGILNGLPGALFDGTANYLTMSGAIPNNLAVNAPVSVVLVARYQSKGGGGQFGVIFFLRSNSDSVQGGGLKIAYTASYAQNNDDYGTFWFGWMDTLAGNLGIRSAGGTVDADQCNIINYDGADRDDFNSYDLFTNNSPGVLSLGGAGGHGVAPSYIGAWSNATLHFKGYLFEMFAYDSEITSTDRENIATYIADKYALTQSPDYDPASLPFDFLFYKDYTASGSTLTQWTDSMGNYNATPVSSPTVIFNDPEINGKLAVQLNGQYLEFAGTTDLVDKDEVFTQVMVLKQTITTDSFRTAMALKGASSATFVTGFAIGNASYRYLYTGFTGQDGMRIDVSVFNDWAIIITEYSGTGSNATGLTVSRDGAGQTLTASGPLSGDNAANRIGAANNNTPSAVFVGKIAFAAGGKFAITSEQKTELLGWLSDYYGLAVTTSMTLPDEETSSFNYWPWVIAAGALVAAAGTGLLAWLA